MHAFHWIFSTLDVNYTQIKIITIIGTATWASNTFYHYRIQLHLSVAEGLVVLLNPMKLTYQPPKEFRYSIQSSGVLDTALLFNFMVVWEQ